MTADVDVGDLTADSAMTADVEGMLIDGILVD